MFTPLKNDHNSVRRMLLKGILGSGVAVAMSGVSLSVFAASPAYTELRARAARLANYATFGANEATVSRITEMGWEAWVDEQLSLTTTLLYPSATLTNSKPTKTQFYSAWWTNALVAEDQLSQRVTFALSQWFVISSEHPYLSGRTWTTINFYDMLMKGINGNFKELLFNVSTHPAMCGYLSSLYNKKSDPETGQIPDENYAREVMQLFTCGAEKRKRNGVISTDEFGNRIANYTESDVQELARVFTGIGVKNAGKWGKESGDWLSPVIEYPEYHDSESKQIMGKTIPAGLSLFEDIQAALDIIIDEKLNSVLGSFCQFMIQRLTLSNPKYTYVRDVSIAFRDSGLNIKTLVRAIMLHPHAVDGKSDSRCETGRLKEPLLWYANARRAIAPARDQLLSPTTGPFFVNNEVRTATSFNQAPLAADSVFGFFPWDYQADAISGEQTSYINYRYPEAYLYNWNNVATISNKMWGNFIKRNDDVIRFMDVLTSGGSNEEFADFVLDQLLFGNYRQVLRTELINLLSLRGNNEYQGKVRDALVLVTASPDFLVNNLPQEV